MLNKELVECDDVASTLSTSMSRHDSARTLLSYQVTFISLAGIIRVSIGKMKFGLLVHRLQGVGSQKIFVQ